MRRNAALTVLAVVAGLCLLATPGFAHRAKVSAAGPRLRYQASGRVRPAESSRWVQGSGKRRERIERKERAVRGEGRSRRAQKQTIALGRTRNAAARKVVRRTQTADAPVVPREAVAAPVPVVSVIRQDAVHPQLEGVEEAALRTEILPDLYDERGRLNRIPALKGSHEILLRQNQMADLDGLTRVSDDDDLARMREIKALVALPVNSGLRVDERLEWNRRYCRPWVAQFLVALGAAHYGEFHRPLQVNSAVRTVSFQIKLIRRNGNAAQADGDAASPHLTGQAIDLAKKGLSEPEMAWMRLYLSRLVEEGRIDVEEEFKQACFHVSVYKRYAPPVPQQRIATTHRTLTPALAEALE